MTAAELKQMWAEAQAAAAPSRAAASLVQYVREEGGADLDELRELLTEEGVEPALQLDLLASLVDAGAIREGDGDEYLPGAAASASLSTDAEGHEHKGKGPGGGQFTSQGGGGDAAPAAPPKRAPKPKAPKALPSPYVFGDRVERTSAIYPPDDKLPPEISGTVAHLTPEQAGAVRHYTGQGYIRINRALRSGTDPAALPEEDQATLRGVRSALAAAPELPHAITAWRGLGLDSQAQAQFLAGCEAALKGKTAVEMRGITSTSLNPAIASGFGDVRLEIRAKKGMYINSVSTTPGEREFLIDHGAKYRVVGIKEVPFGGGRKRKVIQMEQILGDSVSLGWGLRAQAPSRQEGEPDRFTATDPAEFVFTDEPAGAPEYEPDESAAGEGRANLSLDEGDRSPVESADSLVDEIIDRGAAAGVAVSDEIRERVRQLAREAAKKACPRTN